MIKTLIIVASIAMMSLNSNGILYLKSINQTEQLSGDDPCAMNGYKTYKQNGIWPWSKKYGSDSFVDCWCNNHKGATGAKCTFTTPKDVVVVEG